MKKIGTYTGIGCQAQIEQKNGIYNVFLDVKKTDIHTTKTSVLAWEKAEKLVETWEAKNNNHTDDLTLYFEDDI